MYAGKANRIMCTQEETLVIGAGGKEQAVNERIESIKHLIKIEKRE